MDGDAAGTGGVSGNAAGAGTEFDGGAEGAGAGKAREGEEKSAS